MKIDFEVPRNKINKICIIRNVGRILGAQNNFPFKYTCAVDKSMEAIRISKLSETPYEVRLDNCSLYV